MPRSGMDTYRAGLGSAHALLPRSGRSRGVVCLRCSCSSASWVFRRCCGRRRRRSRPRRRRVARRARIFAATTRPQPRAMSFRPCCDRAWRSIARVGGSRCPVHAPALMPRLQFRPAHGARVSERGQGAVELAGRRARAAAFFCAGGAWGALRARGQSPAPSAGGRRLRLEATLRPPFASPSVTGSGCIPRAPGFASWCDCRRWAPPVPLQGRAREPQRARAGRDRCTGHPEPSRRGGGRCPSSRPRGAGRGPRRSRGRRDRAGGGTGSAGARRRRAAETGSAHAPHAAAAHHRGRARGRGSACRGCRGGGPRRTAAVGPLCPTRSRRRSGRGRRRRRAQPRRASSLARGLPHPPPDPVARPGRVEAGYATFAPGYAATAAGGPRAAELAGFDGVGAVVAAAEAQLGWPYVWGGESRAEGGFDCSGLVDFALASAGYPVGRLTASGLQDLAQPIPLASAALVPGICCSWAVRRTTSSSWPVVAWPSRRRTRARWSTLSPSPREAGRAQAALLVLAGASAAADVPAGVPANTPALFRDRPRRCRGAPRRALRAPRRPARRRERLHTRRRLARWGLRARRSSWPPPGRDLESLPAHSPFEPRWAVLAQARYLRLLLDRAAGDVPRALAAYNAGWEGSSGAWPAETRAYVAAIMRRFAGLAVAFATVPAHLTAGAGFVSCACFQTLVRPQSRPSLQGDLDTRPGRRPRRPPQNGHEAPSGRTDKRRDLSLNGIGGTHRMSDDTGHTRGHRHWRIALLALVAGVALAIGVLARRRDLLASGSSRPFDWAESDLDVTSTGQETVVDEREELEVAASSSRCWRTSPSWPRRSPPSTRCSTRSP